MDISDYLLKRLPEIEEDLKLRKEQTLSDQIYALVNLTSKSIDSNDFYTAGRCFKLAAWTYTIDNIELKNAIENVFVFSFSRLLLGRERELRKYIPDLLYDLYMKQVIPFGI